MHFENCKWIPQQGRSLCSSFVLSFFGSFRQSFNMFKYMSLGSRNIQTQNCAPIQCKVWPVMLLPTIFLDDQIDFLSSLKINHYKDHI